MEFDEVFKKERATRKFTNRRVSEKLLAKIVKQAQQSPSLLNSQPWRAYAVIDEKLEKLREENKEYILNKKPVGEDFATMLSIDWSTFASQNMATMGAAIPFFLHNKTKMFNDANNDMFNAPAILYLTIPKHSPAWSVFDLGIFAQSIMLIAINNGLSTMPAHSLVAYPELVRKYSGIPEDEMVGMGIALGYSEKNAEINAPRYIPERVEFNKIFKISK